MSVNILKYLNAIIDLNFKLIEFLKVHIRVLILNLCFWIDSEKRHNV